MAPFAFSFVSKDPLTLCRLMRDSSGDDLVKHIATDDLIGVGFVGQGGIGEDSPFAHIKPDPPPMSRAQMVAAAKRWIVQGHGKCAPDIVLEIQHHIQSDPQSARSKVGSAQFDGTVKFEVGLTHREKTPEGWFYGEATVTRPWTVRHVVPSAWKCSGSGSEIETWHFFARVDSAQDSMQVQFGYQASGEKISWTCTFNGMRITDPLLVDVDSSLKSVTMETWSGARTDLNGRRESSFEQLSVTVLDNETEARVLDNTETDDSLK
jgi:hypothetical protein